MKIGLFGGTFNPIHLGHLILAEESLTRFSLDKVIFIPAYIPPHKTVEQNVSAKDRLNMVILAVKGNDKFAFSDYEIKKEGTSYSIDTVKHFKKEYPEGTDLYFLTGADSLEGLASWKNVDELLKMVNLVVATRPGCGDNARFEGRITRMEMPEIGVSSSMIRQRLKKKEPVNYLVPDAVMEYIFAEGLY